MKNIFSSAVVVSLVLSLAACGNKNSDDVKQQVKNDINAKNSPVVQTASYGTTCSSAGFSFLTLKFPGVKTQYDMSDLDFTKKQLYYTDDCKNQAMVVQEKGKVNVVGPSGLVPGAFEEDFNFEHTTVTLTSDVLVKLFNASHVCGLGDWALNGERDVSVQADKILCPGKVSPRKALELVLIEGSNMFLGANSNKDVSEGRPLKLDRDIVFQKQ